MKKLYICLTIIFFNAAISIQSSNTNFDPYQSITKTNQEKFIIGACGHGFFSDFFAVLNNIRWCEENNKIPVVHWDKTSLYYQPEGYNNSENVWEYYFEPITKLTYHQGDRINKIYWTNYTDDLTAYKIDPITRKKTNIFINKYIKIKPTIQKKIDTFFQATMAGKYTIGIHLRGTDKVLQSLLVPLAKIIDLANTYANDQTQFFIASDDINLFNEAKKTLKGTVIFYDSFRTETTQLAWFGHHSHRAKLGEEVLIEAQLLSRCNKLIHTLTSNVSSVALFFNPDLENHVVQ